MSGQVRIFGGAFALAVALILASTASAQATRTWVSGVGDDANPCSRTAPCKTFAGAISKTAAGGEISALDPGGYGAVTITKAITINGDATLAGILNATTNGIIINAAATDDVHIRNVSIAGAGTGLNGIRVLQAKQVALENVAISDQTGNGVDIVPAAGGTGSTNVVLRNVSIRGLSGAGAAGVKADGTSRAVRVLLDQVHIQNVAKGVEALTNATFDVDRSTIGFASDVGVSAVKTTSVVRLSDSTVTGNEVGLRSTDGITTGQIISYNNNRLRGNTTDGAPTSTIYRR